MNADQLLALYDRSSEEPEAIARLRRFVLGLAVRGKLVEQDPADEPASELLKRIAVEKARLVKAGEIRKPKSFDHVEEPPFEIPPSWEWMRLGALGATQTGSTPPKSKPEHYGSEVPFIRPGDLYTDRVDYSGEGLSQSGVHASGRLVPSGSVLMVCIGTIGKCQIVDRSVSFNQQINTLTAFSLVEPRYLLLAMQSDFFQEAAWASSARTTIAILNKGNWEKLPLTLPPVAEQRRIVAKVEELMGLLDRLEAARQGREETRDRLTVSSLACLTAADAEPETLPTHARFVLNTLPALTTRPDQIKQLRQTVLNLAVRGKLVEQDPNDEPASELLKRMAAEKSRLVKAGQIKNGKVPPLDCYEYSFPIPLNWTWTRLGTIGDWGSGSTPSRSNPDFYGGGITWLKSGELGDRVDLRGSEETVTETAVQSGSFRRNKPGDVLIAMYGATIGKLAILADEAVTNQAVCGCSPFTGVSNRFLFLYLLAQRSAFKASSEGGAQPNISKVKIVGTSFPLPPLAEQNRIVAKVDALMGLCDQLEAALTAADTSRARLLDALLHAALAETSLECEAA